MRLQENRVPASLPLTWSSPPPSLLQHHYMRAGTWALKHQRHSVVLNFAQNCPLPISQLQSSREFSFNPIISFNPKLIPANRFFPNRSLARNNERSKDANVFVFGENGQLFKLLTFSLLVMGLVLVYFPQMTKNSKKMSPFEIYTLHSLIRHVWL